MEWIDGGDTPTLQLGEGVTDIGGGAQVVWKRRTRRLQVADATNVEVPRPIGLRQRGGLIPVVGWAVKQQLWACTGCKIDEAVRHVGEGDPYFEGRMGLKRIRPVVLENRQEGPRMHQQAVETGRLQRPCGAVADGLQVRSECRIEGVA